MLVNGKNVDRRIDMKRKKLILKIFALFFTVFYIFFLKTAYAQDTERKIKNFIEFKLEEEVPGMGKPNDIEKCKNTGDDLLKKNQCKEEARGKAKKKCEDFSIDEAMRSLREKGLLDEKFLDEIAKKEGKERIRIGTIRSNLKTEIVRWSYTQDKPDICSVICKVKVEFSEEFKQKMTVQTTGSLSVTIKPSEAIHGGATWRIDNGSWHKSGETVSELSVGTHTIEFGAVDGWVTPPEKSVNIEKNRTFQNEGYYQRKPIFSSLTVTIKPPEAVQDGARWRADNRNWHKSGETVSGLPAGKHTVKFKTIDGWITPGKEEVIIKEDEVSSAKGTYKKPKPSAEILREKIHNNQKKLNKLLEQEKKEVDVKNELIQVYKDIISDCDKVLASDEVSLQDRKSTKTYRDLRQRELDVITLKKGN